MTIHPTGSWIGIYFSEELKAVAKLGYQIQILKLYKFSKCDLFSEYVNKFFEIKRISSGSTKFIGKMHLILYMVISVENKQWLILKIY
jgi:hypothetical protein